jgi:hypothetical protein
MIIITRTIIIIMIKKTIKKCDVLEEKDMV